MESENNEWSTPQELFDKLDNEFHFEIDACAADWNHKCEIYHTELDSCLNKTYYNKTIFMNPPYGKQIGLFIEKAHEWYMHNCTVVSLIPNRSETKWFCDYLSESELRFIKGRVHFVKKDGKTGRPRFSSVVAILKPYNIYENTFKIFEGYEGGK